MLNRKRHRSAIAALFLAGLLSPRAAHAGGNLQSRDPAAPSHVRSSLRDDRQLPVTWVLSHDGFPNSGITNAELAAELSAAFDAWETLPTSKIDFTFGGETPYRESKRPGDLAAGVDGLNLVTFTDPDIVFPPGVLAVALNSTFSSDVVITSANSDLDGDGVPDLPEGVYPAGTIFDADIVFNTSHPWSLDGHDDTLDIGPTAIHEIGHTIGLSHSMIRDAIMWPFANDAELPAADDVAFASLYYPQIPDFAATFGSIRGRITSGFSGLPVLGAHVFAVDTTSGERLVGGYSNDDGTYFIPGLPPGEYLVGIEPLDGSPSGLDPIRINPVIASTTDTNFPEEFYDADESSVETNPLAAQAVTVVAGAATLSIDLATNTLQVPSIDRVLHPGFNLFTYPTEVPSGLSAFALLQAIGDATRVRALDRLTAGTSTFERAEYVDGQPAGSDFPIRRGEGYVVYANAQTLMQVSGDTDCPTLNLHPGTNLIGVPCPPAQYTAFAMLQDLGGRYEVRDVQRFDADSGTYEIASYDSSGAPTGTDFPVVNGEGYVATLFIDKLHVRIPPSGSGYAPRISGVSPGRGVTGTQVLILGEGFDPDAAGNVVRFNGTPASVQFATTTSLTVVVPPSATTGPLIVRVGGIDSNAVQFVVDPSAVLEDNDGDTEIVSDQTATGTISMDGEQDRYTFTAIAGSLVTIAAEATTGVPDLLLVLEDPLGVITKTDDNSAGDGNPLINNFELAQTGTYTVVVTSVPGSGTGPYHLSLKITPRSTPARVSALDGDIQTGVAGSTLPVPLSILLNGPTGAPLAGVPVTFTATNVDLHASSIDPTNASTVLLNTNASGIVAVQVTLPTAAGEYEIIVAADLAQSATLHIAVTDRAVATIEILGNGQSGSVAQPLAAPLQIRCLDNVGQPVSGALVQFQVASGGGLVTPSGVQQTGSAGPTHGLAGASFTLGHDVDDAQIVAARVPGRHLPVLFEATPHATLAARVGSDRTSYNRVTLGTGVLNALVVQVFDQFDNPVEGQEIVYTIPPALDVVPGVAYDGTVYSSFLTDAKGQNVAAVFAPSEYAIPSIDEFGNKRDVGNNAALGLAETYRVVATVAGTGLTQSFDVDVDMGPRIVGLDTHADPALWPHAKIGVAQPSPVRFAVLRHSRNLFDFRSDDFTHLKFVLGVEQVSLAFRVQRADGENEADVGLTPTQVSPLSATTNVGGLASATVTMGDVGGTQMVIASAAEIAVQYCFDAGTVGCPQIFVDDKQFATATPVKADPVIIRAEVADSASGLDLRSVKATLNGTTFFDGSNLPPAPYAFPTFPRRLDLFVGGVRQEALPYGAEDNSAFSELAIEYWPARRDLHEGTGVDANSVQLFAPKDHAGNAGINRVEYVEYP